MSETSHRERRRPDQAPPRTSLRAPVVVPASLLRRRRGHRIRGEVVAAAGCERRLLRNVDRKPRWAWNRTRGEFLAN